jgi:hypothetical protein
MRSFIKAFLILNLSLLFLAGCKSEVDDFTLHTANEYFPSSVGKEIIYRLDSTVFISGRFVEVHSYQEKHVVDALITDNLNRSSYRIFRYLRDSAGLQQWKIDGTYFITPSANSVEVIEDNLRIIKLASPLRTGHTWKGTSFLSLEPYSSIYDFSNDDDMDLWEFKIDGIDETITINGKTYTDVISVSAIDQSFNVPITDFTSIAIRSLYKEKYAKNIGLIEQDYILWDYQPTTANTIGFGVKRRIISHN